MRRACIDGEGALQGSVPARAPIGLVFLWHFHQPWYRGFGGGPATLPWVRLHALKDYADLPAILAEEPRVPHAANLVPALLDQIELAAAGASDAFLEVARAPVSSWDEAAVDFALDNFFSAHPQRIEPLSHYAELARRRARALAHGREALRAEFTADELRDLVVLFHLAWSGETLSRDPLLVKLRRHGHRFSEEEKEALLDRQAAFLSETIPAWKRAFQSGVVEAATSPYHHPILPLLISSEAGREALPQLPSPSLRLHRPEDARAQIALGLATFERHFGFRPKGMWPPEGAISEAALALIREAGISWVASDEEVLFHSLPASRLAFEPGDRARTLFRPYTLSSAPSPAIFFRDRVLSDRIGFSYATWPAADAAADFVARLLSIHEAAPDRGLTVPVILDGENAWESYPQNGALFLRALAAAIAAEPRIRTMTPSQALAQEPPAPLERLVAGSWVNGNLTTWVGAPAKNRAWDLLIRARETLGPEIAGVEPVPPAQIAAGLATPAQAAQGALFAAEASDWFWWFGDDHTSAHDPVFDALFRNHVASAYRALGHGVPADLDESVDGAGAPDAVLASAAVSPTIDGGIPDYFEWLGAARFSGQPRGAMNRGAGLLKEIFFGAGGGSGLPAELFLRLDPAVAPASASLAGITARISVRADRNGAAADDEPADAPYELPLEAGVRRMGSCRIGVDRIVEIAIPAPASLSGTLQLRVHLVDAQGRELEALPSDGWLRFRTVRHDWSA